MLFAMVLFAFVGAVSPGPVNLVSASSGLAVGFRRTLPHVLGASIAYAGVVFISGVGLYRVILLLPWFQPTLMWVGSGYLLYVAWQLAMSVAVVEVSAFATPNGFMRGAIMQLLNPKAWIVAASGVSLFVLNQSSVFMYLVVFTLVSFFICCLGVGTWAAMGQALSRWLNNEVKVQLFNRAMALLLCAAVGSFFYAT